MKGPQLAIAFIALLLSLAAAKFNVRTDSKISAVLGDSYGRSIWIQDLRSWGLMSPDHDYFERGNLDAFSVRDGCIGPPCHLNLTSDGIGRHHGWYCDYVEVTSTGPQAQTGCSQTVFFIDQWLAVDVPPFQLTAYRDECYRQDEKLKRGRQGPLIVGNSMVET
ncbi:hypothetical protein V6N12_019797 [Hibiscus sabdariffa]|uniref:PLAT domain-containing protein n=1 Tax=Hibiscus sabdariffa TaxID=183260 RepID=A0ABR1ZEN1_9ROSI